MNQNARHGRKRPRVVPPPDDSDQGHDTDQGHDANQSHDTDRDRDIEQRQRDHGLPKRVGDALIAFRAGYMLSAIKPGKVSLEKERQRNPSLPLPTQPTGWTMDLEAQAEKILRKTKKDWEIPRSVIPAYSRLYQACSTHARCTPSDIVGIRNRLVFQLDAKTGSGSTKMTSKFPGFTTDFCTKLERLVSHPAWMTGQPGGRAAMLGLAIQYAVILRTNDRRKWEPRVAEPFMTEFRRVAKEGVCKRRAHAKVRAAFINDGEFMPFYCISNILAALEQVVDTPNKVPRIGQDEYYYVRGRDLTNLTNALDSMVDPETKIAALSTAVYHSIALSIRPMKAFPKGQSALEDFHEGVMLEEKRRAIQHEMGVEQIPEPERDGSISVDPTNDVTRDALDDCEYFDDEEYMPDNSPLPSPMHIDSDSPSPSQTPRRINSGSPSQPQAPIHIDSDSPSQSQSSLRSRRSNSWLSLPVRNANDASQRPSKSPELGAEIPESPSGNGESQATHSPQRSSYHGSMALPLLQRPVSSHVVEPANVEPANVEPANVEPVKVEPANVEPVKVEPANVEPANVEPVKVEPANVEPANVEPVKVEPANVEPANVEPANVEPAKVEPANDAEPATRKPGQF